MFGESVYLYGVSPMLRFGEHRFDGGKVGTSRGLPRVCRMGLGWNWGRLGSKNVGGREQLRAFLSVPGAFRMLSIPPFMGENDAIFLTVDCIGGYAGVIQKYGICKGSPESLCPALLFWLFLIFIFSPIFPCSLYISTLLPKHPLFIYTHFYT